MYVPDDAPHNSEDSNDSNGSIFDSNPTNYVAKQQLYKSYVFPESSADRAIIRQCASGVGYERRYHASWARIIDKLQFDRVMDNVNKISYRVFDEKQRDDAGIEYMNVHWYRRLAMGTLLGGVGLCAYLAYREIDKGAQGNVALIFYLIVFLIAVSSLLMIGVIVHALTTQIPLMNDREILRVSLEEYFRDMNAKNAKAVAPGQPYPEWSLGERLFYLTVNSKV